MGESITLLKELIKIDSSTKAGANEAVAYCHRWLENRGLEVKKIKNNGYHMLVCQIGKGEETIILNGHVDVIEAEDQQFHPYVLDGKMYGRGAVDMKAGVATMMETVAKLKDQSLSTSIMLQIVPDEETGGVNGTKYLTEQGYLGDFIICGEPTNMGIAIQSKGVLQLDFTIRGKPAHGSRPWEGNNAISKAYNLYEEIFQLPFAQETAPPMFDKPSINLAKLNGGTVYNKVPEKCHMSLDIRYLPHQSPSAIFEQIQKITDGTVTIHICNQPVTTKEDNPFVQVLADAIKRKTQLEQVNIYGQHGSNDGQFFTKYGGASVECGPVGHDWHGDNEMVYMDSVKDYQHVLEDFILAYDQKN
ncbi:M20/M25/M40 family metallo-hydrolase [Salipaludibacillus agaradhaerens]|uniref:M20/M25/M40 family metallo-hydrolase n=1 Tax=Salipaludibacillus agaradhaerens TaxID=76935 RepID=A0A9Q4B3K9_SALAG|nr:M20/M25/M40 family metallo-hydrolase [Salipaludibacillus agaradhaerens]MCR6097704.1 M20/M25/M40 family metallo-hydrolase [Salipaludibacillus agaradhaerens]MCR6112812.1 M20/M25/M40 family metallo-hydrolase [Salipaludibacillus agaradhaerens]